MALDAGKVNAATRASMRAARCATAASRSTISMRQHRFLTVPEIFTYSSNIGTARMALMVGVEGHKAFLRKMGQLDRMRTELPESAEPIVPKRWGELNTMTIAFGHGLAVAPIAGHDGGRRAGQRRLHDHPDLPEAERGGSARRTRRASSSPRPAKRCAI